MKKRYMLLLLILAVLLAATALFLWNKKPNNSVPTVSDGTLERYPAFESKFISSRDVAVWLPEGYQPGDSCDVLYMHDGQMLFDSTTTWNHQEWEVDETLARLIKENTIRPTIVVAIDNTSKRLDEYFPTKTYQYVPQDKRKHVDVEDFKGDEYLRFIVEELKPFIDERYQPLTSREHTFMAGSSMGGLISLYALCEYPQVFGGVACLSSHLSMAHLSMWMKDEVWANAFREYVKNHLPEANSSLIYMDHGTKDLDAAYGPYQEQLDTVFAQAGWTESHYRSLVFEGHGHKETFWAMRLPNILTYLLSK